MIEPSYLDFIIVKWIQFTDFRLIQLGLSVTYGLIKLKLDVLERCWSSLDHDGKFMWLT